MEFFSNTEQTQATNSIKLRNKASNIKCLMYLVPPDLIKLLVQESLASSLVKNTDAATQVLMQFSRKLN